MAPRRRRCRTKRLFILAFLHIFSYLPFFFEYISGIICANKGTHARSRAAVTASVYARSPVLANARTASTAHIENWNMRMKKKTLYSGEELIDCVCLDGIGEYFLATMRIWQNSILCVVAHILFFLRFLNFSVLEVGQERIGWFFFVYRISYLKGVLSHWFYLLMCVCVKRCDFFFN